MRLLLFLVRHGNRRCSSLLVARARARASAACCRACCARRCSTATGRRRRSLRVGARAMRRRRRRGGGGGASCWCKASTIISERFTLPTFFSFFTLQHNIFPFSSLPACDLNQPFFFRVVVVESKLIEYDDARRFSSIWRVVLLLVCRLRRRRRQGAAATRQNESRRLARRVSAGERTVERATKSLSTIIVKHFRNRRCSIVAKTEYNRFYFCGARFHFCFVFALRSDFEWLLISSNLRRVRFCNMVDRVFVIS